MIADLACKYVPFSLFSSTTETWEEPKESEFEEAAIEQVKDELEVEELEEEAHESTSAVVVALRDDYHEDLKATSVDLSIFLFLSKVSCNYFSIVSSSFQQLYSKRVREIERAEKESNFMCLQERQIVSLDEKVLVLSEKPKAKVRIKGNCLSLTLISLDFVSILQICFLGDKHTFPLNYLLVLRSSSWFYAEFHHYLMFQSPDLLMLTGLNHLKFEDPCVVFDSFLPCAIHDLDSRTNPFEERGNDTIQGAVARDSILLNGVSIAFNEVLKKTLIEEGPFILSRLWAKFERNAQDLGLV